jgi:hypothetical protein
MVENPQVIVGGHITMRHLVKKSSAMNSIDEDILEREGG